MFSRSAWEKVRRVVLAPIVMPPMAMSVTGTWSSPKTTSTLGIEPRVTW